MGKRTSKNETNSNKINWNGVVILGLLLGNMSVVIAAQTAQKQKTTQELVEDEISTLRSEINQEQAAIIEELKKYRQQIENLRREKSDPAIINQLENGADKVEAKLVAQTEMAKQREQRIRQKLEKGVDMQKGVLYNYYKERNGLKDEREEYNDNQRYSRGVNENKSSSLSRANATSLRMSRRNNSASAGR